MGKSKKQQPVWLPFLKGLAVSLGVYVGGHLLLAALAVRGVIGEEGVFPVTAVLCVAASLCGGACVVRRCPWGPLPGGVLAAVLFGTVLAMVGGLCWQSVTWAGHGGMLLGCALLGGAGAGILGARRRKRKRRPAL